MLTLKIICCLFVALYFAVGLFLYGMSGLVGHPSDGSLILLWPTEVFRAVWKNL